MKSIGIEPPFGMFATDNGPDFDVLLNVDLWHWLSLGWAASPIPALLGNVNGLENNL